MGLPLQVELHQIEFTFVLQVPAGFVPISQNSPFHNCSVESKTVAVRAMRVAVNQQLDLVVFQNPFHLGLVGIDNILGFHGVHGLAFGPQVRRDHPALLQGQGKNLLLPGVAAHLLAKLHIFHIVGAQAVTVHQQNIRATQFNQVGILQQRCAGILCKFFADQEVPVAMHEKSFGPVGNFPQLCLYTEIKSIVLIVPNPGVKEIAQDVERVCGLDVVVEEPVKRRLKVRTAGVQVQV